MLSCWQSSSKLSYSFDQRVAVWVMCVLYVQQSLMSKPLCGALIYQPLSPVSHNGMRSDWLTKQAWKRVREKCQEIRKLPTERQAIDCGTQIQSFILSCFFVILYGIVTAHIQVQKAFLKSFCYSSTFYSYSELHDTLSFSASFISTRVNVVIVMFSSSHYCCL